jgi:hypothetical protein
MRASEITPMGALARGLVAGAVGAFAQDVFFRLTGRVRPSSPEQAFTPPEPQQASEASNATVARRFVEGMMARAPLSEEAKARGGRIVHYAFGSAFGGLYGLARESIPALRRGRAGGGAATLFGTAVWAFGDELLLPAFRLSGRPEAYPASVHAYAYAAHLAYGAAVAGAYGALRPRRRGLARVFRSNGRRRALAG